MTVHFSLPSLGAPAGIVVARRTSPPEDKIVRWSLNRRRRAAAVTVCMAENTPATPRCMHTLLPGHHSCQGLSQPRVALRWDRPRTWLLGKLRVVHFAGLSVAPFDRCKSCCVRASGAASLLKRGADRPTAADAPAGRCAAAHPSPPLSWSPASPCSPYHTDAQAGVNACGPV